MKGEREEAGNALSGFAIKRNSSARNFANTRELYCWRPAQWSAVDKPIRGHCR